MLLILLLISQIIYITTILKTHFPVMIYARGQVLVDVRRMRVFNEYLRFQLYFLTTYFYSTHISI